MGTVSRWPASTIRCAAPVSVRAMTTLPSSLDIEIVESTQRGLHGVRDRLLVTTNRRDVDQRGRQRRDVRVDVESHRLLRDAVLTQDVVEHQLVV